MWGIKTEAKARRARVAFEETPDFFSAPSLGVRNSRFALASLSPLFVSVRLCSPEIRKNLRLHVLQAIRERRAGSIA